MKSELANYKVFPKIILSKKPTEVTIKPLGPHAAFCEKWFFIQMIPMRAGKEPRHDYDVLKVNVNNDGCLVFTYTFSDEQEYKIRVFKSNIIENHDAATTDTSSAIKPKNVLITFNVYVLYKDLYFRRPYRGDFHVHSSSSGGEAPEITAANFRKKGFDFYALTDHYKFWPSAQCRDYYKNTPADFLVITGEEIHSPDNFVHIIGVGGKTSVNEIYQKDSGAYDREVREILKQLEIPEGVDGYAYAACIWVFRKINETGGMSIFAHPHWMADAYHVPDALTNMLFKSRAFDAFELLGGHELHSNNLQIAYYNDERANGNTVPIVGSSDAHSTLDGAEWFTYYSTIVFANELDSENIIAAVKDMYAVAVESWPNEQSRVYGAYRMVSYARFLLEEYFPVHDELCFEEGLLMKQMFLGDGEAEEILKLFKGRTKRLSDSYWTSK